MFRMFVVSCAKAMNKSVTTKSTGLSTAEAKTWIGSTTPVAEDTIIPIIPMNSVAGRIELA